MARIIYSGTFGQKMTIAVSLIHQLKDSLNRCKSVADALTAGGTTPALLEGSPEFNVSTGGGATFYNDLVALVSAFNGINPTTLTDLDQGLQIQFPLGLV